MADTPLPLGDGCLICLVQTSDSMRDTVYSGPFSTKIAAALRVVDWLIDDLLQFVAEKPADSTRIFVGVLAYSTRSDGRPRLRQLLRGSSPDHPLMPLSDLAAMVKTVEEDGRTVWVETKTSGEAPAHAAFEYTRGPARAMGRRTSRSGPAGRRPLHGRRHVGRPDRKRCGGHDRRRSRSLHRPLFVPTRDTPLGIHSRS